MYAFLITSTYTEVVTEEIHVPDCIEIQRVRIYVVQTTYQLFWPHVVQDPFGILTVMAALHNGKKQLGGVILREHQQVQLTQLARYWRNNVVPRERAHIESKSR